MSKILLLTGYNSAFEPIAALTIPKLREYAARHAHPILVHEEMDAGSLAPSWAKIAFIRDALASDVNFVFWIDADALIVRPDQDIRDYISGDGDLHIAWHGPEDAQIMWPGFIPHYNAGVMVVRNTAWARDFFERVWFWRGKIKHYWNDQAAIHHVLGRMSTLGMGDDIENESDQSRVAHLDCAWNTIPGGIVVENPIIHHYAGIGSEREHLIKVDIALQNEIEQAPEIRKTIFAQYNILCLRLRLAHRRWAVSDHESNHFQSTIQHLQTDISKLNADVSNLTDHLFADKSEITTAHTALRNSQSEAEHLRSELVQIRSTLDRQYRDREKLENSPRELLRLLSSAIRSRIMRANGSD